MYIYTPSCRYWITLYRYVLVFIVPHVDIELEDNKQFISNIPRMPRMHLFTWRSRLRSVSKPRSPKDLWNTSRYPYLDISNLQNWGKNKSNSHISQMNMLTPEVRYILKTLWKRREIVPMEQFLPSTIFCYLLLDFHVKIGTRISLWDKRLLEISKVEITRMDCISIL